MLTKFKDIARRRLMKLNINGTTLNLAVHIILLSVPVGTLARTLKYCANVFQRHFTNPIEVMSEDFYFN